ncbi:YebG family protein [Endothiovibrio diazotrophicus]
MAVIVEYIVERDGVRKMTFVSKKEADAYDRMLDIADALIDLLGEGAFGVEEGPLEEIALHLAKNADRAAAILKGAKPKPKAQPAAQEEAPSEQATEDPEAPAKAPRTGRRKAA